MSKKQAKNDVYKKRRSPFLIVLYVIVLLALIGCIGYFFYSSMLRQSDYEDIVRQASLNETEMIITRVEEESETESETETETEAVTETEAATEPESESGTETEAETDSAAEQETEETGQTQASSYAPVLTVSANSEVITAGDSFDPVSYVESITDDADNMYTLWRNINVEGDYDVEVPGVYELTIYAVDSSGYVSNKESFILVVLEPETETASETEPETESETESEAEPDAV